MTSQPDKDNKTAGNSPTERLMASPVRLAVLCVAVLVLSASAGVLIGKIFKPFQEDSVPETVTVTAQAPLPPLWPSARVATPPPLVTDITIPKSTTVSKESPPESEPDVGSPAPLQEEAQSQPQPDSATEDEPAWKRYAALAPPIDGSPMIALVIDDMGLSRERVEEVAELPALLTLAFLPYAPSLQDKVDFSRKHGHEIMLHLPMEPMDAHVDPGPDALLTELSDVELTRRLIKNLDSFTGYVGVNNHMGSRFTADKRAMSLVMDIMAKRGLLFLDSKTTAASDGYKLAVQRGMPSAKRDIFIDNVIAEKAILAQLKKVEKVANRKGVVIVIGHPHPATISALRHWLPEAKKNGFRFVPLSVVTALTFNG